MNTELKSNEFIWGYEAGYKNGGFDQAEVLEVNYKPISLEEEFNLDIIYAEYDIGYRHGYVDGWNKTLARFKYVAKG